MFNLLSISAPFYKQIEGEVLFGSLALSSSLAAAKEIHTPQPRMCVRVCVCLLYFIFSPLTRSLNILKVGKV